VHEITIFVIYKRRFQSNFNYLFPVSVCVSLCHMSKLASKVKCQERENQQDAAIRCLLSTSSQHVSGIIMPIFRRTKTVCYSIWCTVLVLLDVVGSGCGALRCRMRALWSARILQRKGVSKACILFKFSSNSEPADWIHEVVYENYAITGQHKWRYLFLIFYT